MSVKEEWRSLTWRADGFDILTKYQSLSPGFTPWGHLTCGLCFPEQKYIQVCDAFLGGKGRVMNKRIVRPYLVMDPWVLGYSLRGAIFGWRNLIGRGLNKHHYVTSINLEWISFFDLELHLTLYFNWFLIIRLGYLNLNYCQLLVFSCEYIYSNVY